VLLRIDGVEVNGTFIASGIAVSKHTGRNLTLGSVEFDIHDSAENEKIIKSLSKHRRFEAQQGNGLHFVSLKVLSNSYSTRDNRPLWHHTIEVEETENLNPTEVVLDGLTLHPYKYEERAEQDGIVIQQRVSVDAARREELEIRLRVDDHEPGRYFDVVRVGLQENPRTMRFGRCFWSEQGDETKYALTLVEKSIDDAKPEPFPEFYPEIPNMRSELALLRNLMTELLNSLVESGSLSPEQRSAIEDRANVGMWTRHWALFKLDDIDKHV
jgi:hypothetical protein